MNGEEHFDSMEEMKRIDDNMAEMNRIQRERIRRSQPQRQEQLSELILGSSALAQFLRQTIQLRQMATTDNEISFYNRQASSIERRIYQYFERSFGINLFEILTQPEPDASSKREQSIENEVIDFESMDKKVIDFHETYLKAVDIIAESLQELSNVACTPDEYVHNAEAILARLAQAGIIVDDVNEGTEPDASSEREHPVKIGDVISGLRVVQTSWPEGDVPMFRLDGESDWRRLYSFSAPSPPPQP
jgi:hypothetical protein